MKRHRHTLSRQSGKSAEGERLLADGADLAQVLRMLEISEAKRLRELEAENARLKRLVANQALDIDLLKELAEGNF